MNTQDITKYWLKHTDKLNHLIQIYDAFKQTRYTQYEMRCRDITHDIETFLGYNWKAFVTLKGFDINYLNEKGESIFGLTIKGDFKTDISGKHELVLNYGTCGTWNPLTDNYKQKYLKGLYMLSSDKAFLSKLKQTYIDFNNWNYNMNIEQARFENTMENPSKYYKFEI